MTDVPVLQVERLEPVGSAQQAAPGHWIRLSVTNTRSTPVQLGAQIMELSVPPGPEVPWWLPWRHSKTRATTLYPGVPEMLLVATVQANQCWFRVLEYDGDQHRAHQCTINQDWTAKVVIWDMALGIPSYEGRLDVQMPPENQTTGMDFTLTPLHA